MGKTMPFPFLLVGRLLLIVAVLLSFSCSHKVNIDKGQIDDRKYQYFVLDNHLKVLLISDAQADKAAASLDVNVGSSSDPKDREGLAHFLEHMLFLGTKKYPNAADYQAFIDDNGGGHNAYTSAEHTNYFFDIDATRLDAALDRFSQFFITPLFDANYVDRERNAVHSEYQSKIKDDYRRGYDVYRQLINPDHPYAKFSVGSLTTLANRPNDNVRDDLLAFYKKHYSSDRMTLVVLGKESLADLKTMVVERFSQIPQHSTVVEKQTVPLFLEQSLPIEVVSRPIKNIRQMSMVFPLPSIKQYYGEKPLNYIGHLLGHEGKGSVLSILKQRGWAESLSAGGGDNGAGNATFSINIDLTKEGIKHREMIRALVFHAIDTVREKGVVKWRFKEEQQLAKVAFQFREKGRAISTVRHLADQLHDYPAAEVISARYLYKKFDPALITRLLAQMTPDNLYVSTVYPESVTNKVTHHYDVPYAVYPLPNTSVEITENLKNQYQLPEKNVFVPTSSELFAVDNALSTPKKATLNSDDSSLWLKQDIDFNVPKATINVRVKLPLVASSLQNATLNELLIWMINDRLNENSYPALIAGLSYSLSSNNRGFEVSIKGYDNKMDVLLAMVGAQVKTPDLNEARFDDVKNELLRQLNNTQQQTPFRQLMGQLPVTLYSPYWSDVQMAQQLEKVTFSELQRFSKLWLQGSTLQGLFYGNFNAELAEQWKVVVEDIIQPGNHEIRSAKVVKFPIVSSSNETENVIKEKSITVDHNDKAVGLYVQGVSDSLGDQAKMVLLRQVLESSFYSQLRTEQQLGYIVFLTSMTFKDVPGSLFVVQSPSASVKTIKQAIQQFILASSNNIPDDLSAYKRSAATKLLEKPQSLSAKSSLYWRNILREDESFSYRQRLVDSINAITTKQLIDYYQKTLLNDQAQLWFVADKDADYLSPVWTKEQAYYHYH